MVFLPFLFFFIPIFMKSVTPFAFEGVSSFQFECTQASKKITKWKTENLW